MKGFTEAEDAALDAAEAAHLEECPFEPGTCWECEERAQSDEENRRFEQYRDEQAARLLGYDY